MLTVADLHVSYGQVQALRGVSLRVGAGETVCLIGANGAGKSTLLNCISGLVPREAGSIEFDGRLIAPTTPAHEIVRLGIIQIPEGRQLFMELSVFENLRLGAFRHRWDEATARILDDVYAWFPVLKTRADQTAGSLSGGEQQMLAIGRALMARPRMLLIDEPSMGLAPVVVQDLFERIRAIGRGGMPILLVEQNALMALEISARGYVLETGRIVLEGSADVLRRDEGVRKAYLGGTVAGDA
ncbi:MAG: ABC transporter ATP-binding protein [Armatimonadota bacterium]|nr:ABC transporter ATP-binding protein [Armatimonadota bacterium]